MSSVKDGRKVTNRKIPNEGNVVVEPVKRDHVALCHALCDNVNKEQRARLNANFSSGSSSHRDDVDDDDDGGDDDRLVFKIGCKTEPKYLLFLKRNEKKK